MIKLGITGYIGSGKTSVTNIIKKNTKIPTFCADDAVNVIYKKDIKIKKKLFKIEPSLKNKKFLKKKVINLIYKNKKFLNKLEKIIHPLVRKRMNKFIKKNKNKKTILLDIPLLIENKLYKKLDKIILIQCKRELRIKRFLKTGRDINLFKLLEKKQLSFVYKKKFADYIIKNNKNLKNLKKNVVYLIKNIEKNA